MKFDHIFYSETVWSPNSVVSDEKFFYDVIRSLDRAKIKHEIKQREHYDYQWNGSYNQKIVVGITFDLDKVEKLISTLEQEHYRQTVHNPYPVEQVKFL